MASRSRLVFFGNERIATGVTTKASALQALIEAGYEIAGVIVAQEEAAKSRKARPLEVAEIAKQYSIPVLAPPKLAEALEDIKKLGAEAGVLIAYGKIVPQSVIDAFPRGIINVHPSLLPLHRGPTPLESVLIAGEKETGVSLMQLVAKMDAGPIYAQETVLLRGDETKQQLADQLLSIGKDMLVQYLPDILSGKLKPAPQDDARATYDQKVTKESAELDWSKPAPELAAQVRTHLGWPRSRGLIGTTQVIITSAHATDTAGVPGTLYIAGREFGIHCGEGTLMIDMLIPPGKKEMTAAAFLAGYHPV